MNKQPGISLIIPVFNESKTIAELIATINKQSLPPDEIILTDAGSTDNTVALIKQLSGNDQRFRYRSWRHCFFAGR